MNVKTTLLLLVALVCCAAGIYVVKTKEKFGTPATEKPKVETPPGVKKLITEELGEIRKVVVQRAGSEPWTFEKQPIAEGDTATKWWMTSPMKFVVNQNDITSLSNKIKDLQYEISYKSGQAGVTPASAGLEPAEATVSITDDKGKTYDVEFGKAQSDQTVYVRRKGAGEIIVGKTTSKNLVKAKAAEYRDTLLWTFKPDQATRLEFTDRTNPAAPTTTVLVKADGKWAFESPTAARATAKVDDMVRALSALRVSQWLGDQGEQVASYGFNPPAWTIKATVTEEVSVKSDTPAATDNDNAAPAEPKTEKKEKTYVVEISDRSPIGEDTKAYLRVGGEPAVATLMKATTDRLKPVMNEWRDMKLTSALTSDNVKQVSRIEIRNKDGSLALAKKDNAWVIEGSNARAEDSAVSELIKSITDLKAVSFTDGEKIDEAKYGLTNPTAEVRLTITGIDEPERIIVGGSTDASTNLLSYVRRNDSAVVGKVRVADLANITRGPNAYRDRKFLDLTGGKIERLDVSANNRFGEGKIEVGLTQTDGTWSMAAPVAAKIRDEVVKKLAEALVVLKAQAVVDDKGNVSAFGLDQPQATLKIGYKPPVEFRVEAVKDENGQEKNVSTEIQPPTQTIELQLTQHDGKFYGKRADRPTIYELTSEFYEQLFAEFRASDVFSFDDTKVTEFSIRNGATTHAFEKKDGKWKYKAEPDLPFDTKKVQNLLLQLKDLRSDRFVAHTSGDLAKFGLDNPPEELVVIIDKDPPKKLLVSGKSAANDPAKGNFATVPGQEGIFLFTPDTVKRFQVTLSALE